MYRSDQLKSIPEACEGSILAIGGGVRLPPCRALPSVWLVLDSPLTAETCRRRNPWSGPLGTRPTVTDARFGSGADRPDRACPLVLPGSRGHGAGLMLIPLVVPLFLSCAGQEACRRFACKPDRCVGGGTHGGNAGGDRSGLDPGIQVERSRVPAVGGQRICG
jgi:hypothetical protein